MAKTKALISFAVTAKLICAFVLAYAKSQFSHNELKYVVTKFHVVVLPLVIIRINIVITSYCFPGSVAYQVCILFLDAP